MRKTQKLKRFLSLALALSLCLGLLATSGLTLTAKAAGTEKWVLVDTDHAIVDGDTVLITATTKDGTMYGMDRGSKTQPVATKLTTDPSQLSDPSTVANSMKWTAKIVEGGYTFYVLDSTTDYLYAGSSTNNCLKFSGTPSSKGSNVFEIDSNNQLNVYPSKVQRYVGVYIDGLDWRAYTSTTTNLNNQKYAIYKLEGGCKHEWGDWVTTDATCTKAGVKTRTCSVCSAEETQTIPMLAHSYGEDGVCTGCGISRTAIMQEIVDKLYALGAGEKLENQTLTGEITKINTSYSSSNNYITVTIVVEGREDKPVQCYHLTGGEGLKVGDVITVTGTLTNYKGGTYEFDAGATYALVPKAVLKGASTTLEGNIGLNYYVTLPDSAAKVQFKVEGKDPVQMEISKGTPITEGDYAGTHKFTYPMNAKQMHDQVTFEVLDANNKKIDLYLIDSTNQEVKDEDSAFVYSLAEYFTKVSADTSTENAKLKALADAAITYGSYAQVFFNKTNENTDFRVEVEGVTIADTHQMEKIADLPDQLTFSGISLILETETTLRVYFKADLNNVKDYTFNLRDGANVKTLELVPSADNPGIFYVAIQNIASNELDTRYTLQINGVDTLSFSALSYAQAVIKANKDAALCDLVKALYLYNEAADAYFIPAQS